MSEPRFSDLSNSVSEWQAKYPDISAEALAANAVALARCAAEQDWMLLDGQEG